MNTDFKGRSALVIHAANGMGRQAALSLALAGARVLAADGDGEGLRETCSLIRAAGGEAFSVYYEAGPSFQPESLIARARELFGSIDLACFPTSPGRMQLVEVSPGGPAAKPASPRGLLSRWNLREKFERPQSA